MDGQEQTQEQTQEQAQENVERNLGVQPIAAILERFSLKHHDLVEASGGRCNHKMVARACKGRRLTRNTQSIVLDALNAAVAEQGEVFELADLFTYV